MYISECEPDELSFDTATDGLTLSQPMNYNMPPRLLLMTSVCMAIP